MSRWTMTPTGEKRWTPTRFPLQPIALFFEPTILEAPSIEEAQRHCDIKKYAHCLAHVHQTCCGIEA